MKGTVVLAIVALLGCYVSADNDGKSYQSRQKRDQAYLTAPIVTTDSPVPSTTISMSPQTSISVHHTIVRNKPAYPYPYTESTLQSDGTEDTSYYYTYEDISEDASKAITSTVATPLINLSTTKAPVKSFWNSQKALLDARRKENAQKFIPTYNKPLSAPKENKPPIEFKVREKPKFGLANKNKASFTTTKKPEVTTTTKAVELSTSSKVVKTDNQLNLPLQKLSEKDLLKVLKNNNIFPNQIIGRVGDIPVQSNLASQLQSPLRAQSTNINSFGTSRPSKFDDSARNVQFVDNVRPQASVTNSQNNQANLLNSALLSNLKSQPLINLNQQRSAPLNLNQQAASNTQPLLNFNQKQQPLINLNQPPANAFITATAPLGTSGRSGEINLQSPASTLLQRLGALGLGANGGNNALGTSIGRDGGGYGGGYGGGDNKGFTLNLGPVPDPLTFFLRLLSLIPRPLLDLNGKIFFGIELGKNAGLVSGASGGAKPYNG